MLLATSADRIFGVGGPGKLTAREAFAVATTSKVHGSSVYLTAGGFEVRPEFVPDVWALARFERSVMPVGVVDGPMELPLPHEPARPEHGACLELVATRQLGLFGIR
jgi:hypothetical protein